MNGWYFGLEEKQRARGYMNTQSLGENVGMPGQAESRRHLDWLVVEEACGQPRRNTSDEGRIKLYLSRQCIWIRSSVNVVLEVTTPTATTTAAVDPEKIICRFKAVGNASILKRSFYKLSSGHKFQAVILFLRKELGLQPSDPLFVYVNSAFSPAPDEVVANLYRCFSLEGQLVINYSTTQAWG
ncbi:APG12-domain-containing protein [Ramicandelaber brevisporus]|nr:APG12-domain-containing protein [Ramicandelaber brevisporus]